MAMEVTIEVLWLADEFMNGSAMRKMNAVPPTAICGFRCGVPMRESED